ncbi:MAG: peptide ABC transporter substrate-binding protein [Pseudomonadota bacterium]
MQSRFRFLLAAPALVLACTSPASSPYFGRTQPKHPADEVWINNSSEPKSIDPGKCSEGYGGEIDFNLFAGLVEIHPKTLEPTPDIAKTWEISDDGLTYTFHLRQSVWSDGQPLTARDFEWSWKRVLDPKTASQNASLLFPIRNAEAFNRQAVLLTDLPASTTSEQIRSILPPKSDVERIDLDPKGRLATVFLKPPASGTPQSESISRELDGKPFKKTSLHARIAQAFDVGVLAKGDDTLEVTLHSPVPYFLSLVSHYSMRPAPRHLIERLKAEGKDPDLWTRPEHIVSNGPFLLREWRFRRDFLFERNPHYWDAAHVRIRRVRLLSIEHQFTLMNLFKTSDLDWSGSQGSLPPEFMDKLAPYADFHRDPYMAVFFLWVNVHEPPLTDVRVRRALSLAIDRQAFVKYLTRANQVPTSDFVPDGLAGYQSPRSVLYDPKEARRLLAEAGYPDGKNLPELVFSYNTLSGNRLLVEAIQQMWKKELGVRTRLENEEWSVYLERLRMKKFQIGRMSWFGDYPDPYTFLELVTSQNTSNYSGWSSPRYEALLREANLSRDAKTRMGIFRTAEELMLGEQPLIPIYVFTRSYLKKPYLMGFWGNFDDRHPWKYFWIDKRWYGGVPDKPADDPPPPAAMR